MVDPQPLYRGKRTAFSLNAAATDSDTIDCGGSNQLLVQVDMNGAANGDVAVTIIPFESDNTTAMTAIALTPIRTSGPTFLTSRVQFTAQYDVSGYSRVRFDLKNNNAGAQTVNEKSWRLI